MENEMKNETLIDKIKSIPWFVKIFFYVGLFSLILFRNFRELAIAMLILSLYSAYYFFRPSAKGKRVFYVILSVVSFISVFILIAIEQLLD